jgi:hypothetical protein
MIRRISNSVFTRLFSLVRGLSKAHEFLSSGTTLRRFAAALYRRVGGYLLSTAPILQPRDIGRPLRIVGSRLHFRRRRTSHASPCAGPRCLKMLSFLPDKDRPTRHGAPKDFSGLFMGAQGNLIRPHLACCRLAMERPRIFQDYSWAPKEISYGRT